MRAGCFIAPLTFQLYWHSFNIGSPTSEYKAPFANIYRGMAVIGTQVCCMPVLWALYLVFRISVILRTDMRRAVAASLCVMHLQIA